MHTTNETRQQQLVNPCKRFDALLADIFNSPDDKPPKRRREDNNNGHNNNLGDPKTIALLIIMTILIAAVTALAVSSIYCDFAGFDDSSYKLTKTSIPQNKS